MSAERQLRDTPSNFAGVIYACDDVLVFGATRAERSSFARFDGKHGSTVGNLLQQSATADATMSLPIRLVLSIKSGCASRADDGSSRRLWSARVARSASRTRSKAYRSSPVSITLTSTPATAIDVQDLVATTCSPTRRSARRRRVRLHGLQSGFDPKARQYREWRRAPPAQEARTGFRKIPSVEVFSDRRSLRRETGRGFAKWRGGDLEYSLDSISMPFVAQANALRQLYRVPVRGAGGRTAVSAMRRARSHRVGGGRSVRSHRRDAREAGLCEGMPALPPQRQSKGGS